MSLEWTYKRIYWKVRMYLNTHLGWRIRRKTYNGKPILTPEQVQKRLGELVLSRKPFCAGRIGGSEIRTMVAYQPENKSEADRKNTYGLLCCLSGFFGTREDLKRFVRLMESDLGKVDLLGVWFNQMEDYLCKKYGSDALEYGLLDGLEPWYAPEHPWTASLAGKKVVVVHPFADSIRSQYEKRERLFTGTQILPEFDLRVVKAVQTIAGNKDERFATWFDALDYMAEEVCREEFDIALVSCGAYGLPLAVKLKEAGKQAVHVGGALQLLFGIMGKRWEDMPQLKPYVNDAWVRPLETERPKGENQVENSCYW